MPSHGSALLVRGEIQGSGGVPARRAVLILAVACCTFGLVMLGRASDSATLGASALMGVPAQKVGSVMNSLNDKLALHANVDDFVISGDLKADAPMLK